uniref:Ribose 5-phosphate isomerase B n=1 Tax=Eiseniibacteriota bacterium TaxID=2212470 RepID=A0A832I1U7_UNCEI
MKVAVGADHAGLELKERVKRALAALGHEVVDVGTHGGESVDYPDYAIPVAERVARGEADRGVVVCATGIGASIAANKVPGVRCALVTSAEAARLTRQDNDSNVIALAGRFGAPHDEQLAWLATWLDTPFAGGRHARRVGKIESYERARGATEE